MTPAAQFVSSLSSSQAVAQSRTPLATVAAGLTATHTRPCSSRVGLRSSVSVPPGLPLYLASHDIEFCVPPLQGVTAPPCARGYHRLNPRRD